MYVYVYICKKSTETEKVKKENNSKLRRQEIQYLV